MFRIAFFVAWQYEKAHAGLVLVFDAPFFDFIKRNRRVKC